MDARCPVCAERLPEGASERCPLCGERLSEDPRPAPGRGLARPPAVLALAVVDGLLGLLVLLSMPAMLILLGFIGGAPGVAWPMLISLGITTVAGGLLILTAFGIFQLKPWGRILGVVVSVFGVIVTGLAVVTWLFLLLDMGPVPPVALFSSLATYLLGFVFFATQIVLLTRGALVERFQSRA